LPITDARIVELIRQHAPNTAAFEVFRPHRPKAKAPRGRRRPKVTELLREWFEAEPWRTSRDCSSGCKRRIPASSPTGSFGRSSAG
jgi:hypothetical protein